MAAGGRHKGADLRHQRDERILTHVGRFARHVGAGDDQAAVLAAVEGGIIGHEQAALEHLFHHGVAALGDGQLVAVIHHGAAVVVLCRHLRQGRQHIQLCHGVGRALDAVQLGADALQQLVEQAALQRDQPLVCAQDLAFQLLELLSNVALAAGQGLLADIGLRHHALVGVADLDVVTEHMVVADLQLGDAGLLPQAGFQLGQHTLGVVADGAQLVHLGVVALGDDAAVLQGGRCIRVHGRIDAGLDVLQRVDLLRQLCQLRAAAGRCLLPEDRQMLTGLGQRIDFLWGGRTIDRAGHQALHVGNVVQLVGQVAAHDGLPHKALHRVEALVDELAGQQRLLDPAAQHALAHGRAGLVQHPEQRAPLFAAAQRLGEFQIGPGDRRQTHELRLVVGHHGFQALHALDLGVVQILQQCRHGKPYQTVFGHAGGLGPVTTELALQRSRHQTRRIALILHQLHRAGHILFDVGRHFAAVQQARVHQHFAGVEAAQLGDHRRGDLVRRQLGDMGRAGGDVRKAETRFFALEIDAGNVIVAVILQHTALDDRAGGDHADDVALDQPFGLGRVLHLLTDGHLVALGDQTRHIALVAVEGHAAHGGPLFQTALLAGQGQIQLFGRCEGILKEHLVKIADAVEQDLVLVLFFDFQILLHHGRQLCHGFPSLPVRWFCAWFAAGNRLLQTKRGLHCTAAFCSGSC